MNNSETRVRHNSVADDSLQEQQTPERFHRVNFLKQRWPSAVATAHLGRPARKLTSWSQRRVS